MQGLVWRCVRSLEIPVPQDVAGPLSNDAAAIARQNLIAASQSARIRDAFSQAGLPLIFIKGLTLAKLAYADPFAKMSWDVDVLVAKDAAAAAAAQLLRLGYRLVIPDVQPQSPAFTQWHGKRKESVWRSPDGLHVELHTRLADNKAMIAAIDVSSPTQPVEIAPGIVLPTLALDELFAYLCVHGASSAWFRLKWISDLAGLLHGRPPSQIEALYARSQVLGAGRAAAQALLLAHETFGTLGDSELAERLAASPKNRWLADAAAAQMEREREPTQVFLGTATIHLSQLLLLAGAGFKLGQLRRQVSDAIRGGG